MHLVFLNQYYPPDAAPTGVMLQAVAEECARQGHQVTVICADGGYAEGGKLKTETLKAETGGLRSGGDVEHRTSDIEHRREESCSGASATVAGRSSDLQNQQSTIHNHQSSIGDQGSGMRDQEQATAQSSSASSHSTINPQPSTSPLPAILRLPATRFGRGTFVGKLMDYASYYVGVAWRLGTMDPPPDRIVALTTPPYLSVLARAVSKLRGADHAHWVMDLYPDVMVAHGMLAEGGWKYRVLAGLARWGFSGPRCAAVLTLGPDMAERCGGIIRTQSPESRVQTEVEIHSASSVGSSHAAGDKCDGHRRAAPTHPIQNSKFKIQNCSPLISWVPLWGTRADIGHRISNIEHRNEEEIHAAGRSEHGLRRDAAATGIRAQRGWADDELIVMYSGNMGLGHRFGEILELAGARVSSSVEPMEGKSAARQNRLTSSPGTSFSAHRQGESGDSQSGLASSAASPNQRSTPNSPLSSKDTSLRRMNESRDESRGPLLPSSPSYQPSTLNPQLSSVRFVFYGGGKRRGEIEAFMAANPEAPVELHDYAPAEELTAHLMTADVHLVSLEPAWSGTMVPSKLQGIFAVGRPVVFVGSRESSIGRWVEESGGGWVVAAGDVDGLRAALEEARDPRVRLARGEAAGRFAREFFDRQTNVKRVVEALV